MQLSETESKEEAERGKPEINRVIRKQGGGREGEARDKQSNKKARRRQRGGSQR